MVERALRRGQRRLAPELKPHLSLFDRCEAILTHARWLDFILNLVGRRDVLVVEARVLGHLVLFHDLQALNNRVPDRVRSYLFVDLLEVLDMAHFVQDVINDAVCDDYRAHFFSNGQLTVLVM